MPVNRRIVRAGFAAGVLASATIGLVGMATVARAQPMCSTYAALAAADGLRTVVAAPGFSPTDADAQGPAAQAQVDDVAGSNAHAGSPYSEAGAGNAGAGNVDATQLPIFAISSHPSRPEDNKSGPGLTLEARSEALTSAAEAAGGPPATDEATFGRAASVAVSSCVDGVVTATADTKNDVVVIAGVLTMGSVRSHASATVDAAGELTLDGSFVVDGATVLGQGVQITDQGVVFGESPTPLPGNPLAEALDDAGVTVRYLAAERDVDNGQVLAPGLEIIVADSGDGVPGGAAVTYTLGRAYARAAAASSTLPVPSDPPSTSDPVETGEASPVAPTTPDATGSTPSPSTAAAPDVPVSSPTEPASPIGPGVTDVASVLIADVSMENIYPALVAGALALSASWLLFEYLGVRLRWT